MASTGTFQESAYARKLRDPRWQKKRLQILERDEFTCQSCFDTESTLHVHHRYYERGKEPWDYNPDVLVTLCEYCHESETRLEKSAFETLSQSFRGRFFAADCIHLALAIREMKMPFTAALVAETITNILRDEETLTTLVERYMYHRKVRDLEKKLEEAEEKLRVAAGGKPKKPKTKFVRTKDLEAATLEAT